MTIHAPSVIVAEFLIDEGIFTEPSLNKTFPLFISHSPDLPDDIGVIADTIGSKDGRLMEGPNIFHHGLQVRIRSVDYTEGWKKAGQIESTFELVTQDQVLVGAEFYTIQNISQTGPVIFLGLEDGTKRRNLFVVNFLATLKEA